MIKTNPTHSIEYAKKMDQQDPLANYRDKFHIPKQKNGKDHIYMCGNSLGLQPKQTKNYIDQELTDWENLGVEGHTEAKHPWMPYHEFLTAKMAKLVGAKPIEVVMMNTLTTNLHLLMISFYRPTQSRFKILIESDAFPSDKYAVQSQAKYHGFDPKEAILELTPRKGETLIREEDIQSIIEEQGDEIALIMIGGVNYYTGQLFNMKQITQWGHKKGCMVGFDLAHAVGNIELKLSETGADFAAWCTYKYLNAGPGSVGGLFVNERHAYDKNLPKFTGWWGHNKKTRFDMRQDFDMLPGAESWQLSNPPILSLAAILSSLDIFDEIGMAQLNEKTVKLTGYLEQLLDELNHSAIHIITPREITKRGCQLSIQVKNADKSLFDKITEQGVIADWRQPDVIRVAPVPLYNSFEDVFNFVEILKQNLT